MSFLEDLERFTICSRQTASLPAAEWKAAAREAAHPGAVLVTTCQRIETLALAPCPSACPASRSGMEAFRYLAALAAGLHSIALGEREILGQVRSALDAAPPDLAAIISRAIAAARAFRRRQQFDADAGTLLHLALRRLPPPADLLIVGSGPTAAAVSRAAASLDLRSITIVARTAPRWLRTGLLWHPLADLPDVPVTDLAVVALGGDAPVLEASQVPARHILDLSTPRRTHPADPRVLLLRDLRTPCDPARAALLADLEADIQRVLASTAEDAASPVGRFRRAIELRRRQQLDRIARRHPEIPRPVLETITRSLLAHLLHEPSARLRALDPETASLVADIFEAPEPA